jgi:hypothetical protein
MISRWRTRVGGRDQTCFYGSNGQPYQGIKLSLDDAVDAVTPSTFVSDNKVDVVTDGNNNDDMHELIA